MNQSKVCVMLSTYNGAKYIEEQLESLIAQRHIEMDIYIRDDGSSDGTLLKIRKFAGSIPQEIGIHIFEGENVGVIGSFFELMCLTQPKYDFYAFCDQDDVWQPYKLSRAVEQLQSRSSDIPLMYCSSTQMVDQELNHLNIWPKLPPKPLSMYNALVENCCVGCTMVLNPVAFEHLMANLPSDLTSILMHDRWIYLYVSTFGEVIFDEEPSILYRQHQENVMGGSNEGWSTKWKRRFDRFINVGSLKLSEQARLFDDIYGRYLTSTQSKDIKHFLNGLEDSFINRIKYVLNMPFYRQASLDNLVLKLIYVMKKV
ncbi:glycosyltransferase family 2 protein [Paenibacillus amylolyticus]|uniref:Glycosyltransferase family 2 protein n=1 Tax=Paenibacillus amylolyticus TaxID=1451 RepID=A0A5M9WVP5_PAEAM|nr:glycosyltransferase family 2 protein [Paenibacillus amylolyticus]KAA8785655.1 glycosyltransferase family 2 protein [Paenibacillus amylolyticus]MDP9702733.1 glycosyltransferase involved in cell wall biosynthesis [Paenibacillus intestini]